jgi:hypothetical protein
LNPGAALYEKPLLSLYKRFTVVGSGSTQWTHTLSFLIFEKSEKLYLHLLHNPSTCFLFDGGAPGPPVGGEACVPLFNALWKENAVATGGSTLQWPCLALVE